MWSATLDMSNIPSTPRRTTYRAGVQPRCSGRGVSVILTRGRGISGVMSERTFDIAILGAGPAGLSAAARAAQRGLTHVVLESAARHANTIQQYQYRKHVMSEPGLLPLRSDLAFSAGRREEILDTWAEGIQKSNAHIRYRAEVVAISGQQGEFHVQLKGGDVVRTRNVVLAMGIQGNARRLDVPGGDLPCVQTLLEDPDAHRGETIVIVG